MIVDAPHVGHAARTRDRVCHALEKGAESFFKLLTWCPSVSFALFDVRNTSLFSLIHLLEKLFKKTTALKLQTAETWWWVLEADQFETHSRDL